MEAAERGQQQKCEKCREEEGGVVLTGEQKRETGQRRGDAGTRGCYRVKGEGGEERQKKLRVGHFPGENEKSEGVALLAAP